MESIYQYKMFFFSKTQLKKKLNPVALELIIYYICNMIFYFLNVYFWTYLNNKDIENNKNRSGIFEMEYGYHN